MSLTIEKYRVGGPLHEYGIRDEDGLIVGSANTEDDARLFAAARELHDALVAIVGAYEAELPCGREIEASRAVLAKLELQP